MTHHELKIDLWSDVQSVAKEFHLQIENECERLLRDLIEHGVNRIAHEGSLEDFKRIYRAETNLIAFTGGMAFQARFEQLSTLTTSMFEASKKAFCPLWPFC